LNLVPALLADSLQLFFLRVFVKKLLPPGAVFELKIHQNAYADDRPHWGSSQTPSWFSGSRFAAWEGREGRGREERRKREGV